MVRERDKIALSAGEQFLENAVTQFARRLFQGETLFRGECGGVHAAQLERYAALPAEFAGEIRIAQGVFPADAVLDMDGEKVRSRARKHIRERDGITPTRKGKRYARVRGHAQTEFLSRCGFHRSSIKQKHPFVHPQIACGRARVRTQTENPPSFRERTTA